MSDSVHNFTVKDIRGGDVDLSSYSGKVLLIVNTASNCGFTPQYKGLESLYKKYKEQGLEILGFPCNQFASQEKGDNAEIASFCEINFGVSFPLFSKIKVNGSDAEPLYQHLKSQASGALFMRRIEWNFTKFLVDQQGKVIKRFKPTVTPEALEQHVVAALATTA